MAGAPPRACRVAVAVTAAACAAIACGGPVGSGNRDGAAGGADSSPGDGVGPVPDAGEDVSLPVPDAGEEVDPECAALTPLMLSEPRVAAGRFGAGQQATLEVTLTNTGEGDYARYPGARLSSPAPAITLGAELALVPLIKAGEARPLTWTAAVDSSLASGTVVQFSAKIVGGGALDCASSQTLDFSLTVRGEMNP
jgi:hypothetical protein